jgi:gliding motility-associated-like protein
MAPAGDSGRVFVPNAFSPNGDGINDVFSAQYVNVKSIDFNIFDSDNKLLYHTGELNAGWAGDINVEKGVRLYHYKLEATTNKDNKISKCGDFYI